jgi:hypothetical protein
MNLLDFLDGGSARLKAATYRGQYRELRKGEYYLSADSKLEMRS